MPRYFIHMAFDGTGYHGWQVQPNGKTVQEVMEHALSTLLRQEIAVTGAGRTDTGVHASFFIAHFDAAQIEGQTTDKKKHKSEMSNPEGDQFIFKLNRLLPDDIVVYRIRQVPEEMHARFSATHRTYHYHISTLKPLFTRKYAHHLFGPLDLEEIRQCCKIILENTDFTSFSKLHTDVKTNNCKVMVADWKEVDNGFLFEIKADRFLRNMVRSLVGTLLDVGQGKLNRGDFLAIVEAKDRGKAGQSAPAQGLFLVDIGYEGLPA
ncbi:MAG: tRNA pseudouridine(38-40) synthase TruA [Bacteroidales bacterium]|nr:tRNA pseudouridine(38-40) synthase TruA [Bacteroidales bacterium]